MTADEIHEALLLWRAVRACGGSLYTDSRYGLHHVGRLGDEDDPGLSGPTLTDALTSLLTDLREPTLPPPSAERVEEARAYLIKDIHLNGADHPLAVVESLCVLAAREPETVLALIFGGLTDG